MGIPVCGQASTEREEPDGAVESGRDSGKYFAGAYEAGSGGRGHERCGPGTGNDGGGMISPFDKLFLDNKLFLDRGFGDGASSSFGSHVGEFDDLRHFHFVE